MSPWSTNKTPTTSALASLHGQRAPKGKLTRLQVTNDHFICFPLPHLDSWCSGWSHSRAFHTSCKAFLILQGRARWAGNSPHLLPQSQAPQMLNQELRPTGSQRVGHDLATKPPTSFKLKMLTLLLTLPISVLNFILGLKTDYHFPGWEFGFSCPWPRLLISPCLGCVHLPIPVQPGNLLSSGHLLASGLWRKLRGYQPES